MGPNQGGGPPPRARRLLRCVLPEAEVHVVDGELFEDFTQRRARDGGPAARRWYRRQVAGFVMRSVWIRGSAQIREGRRMNVFGGIFTDVKLALRVLRKRPTFAVVAVGTLVLGIVANSAIFTLVSAHFLAPLPYDRPDELVLLWETGQDGLGVTTVAPGNYYSWREQSNSFVDIAAYNVSSVTLSGEGGAAERVTTSVVAPHFFDVLGVRPALGNGFDEQLAREADEQLVILSHSLWTRRYGGDASLVGTAIRINSRPHTVVGIMSPDFRQPERSLTFQTTELWRPMLLDDRRGDYGSRYLRTIARRKEDVSVDQAREEMTLLARRLEQAFPEGNTGRTVFAPTLDEYLLADARPTLLMLLFAGAAVLLIVCANVANLVLARGEERRREFAVLAALGSGRGRLARQIVSESLVLALIGAALGTAIVFAGQGLLQSVQQRFFSGLIDVAVDWRVIGFTASVAVGAGLLFALPLARTASRPELRGALVEGGQRAGRGAGAGTTRNVLIVSQVGMATTLLVVAALLSRSFNDLVNVSPGFVSEGVMTFTVSAPSATYATMDDAVQYHRELLADVRAIPGVQEVGLVSDLMFTTENRSNTFRVEGIPFDPTNPTGAEYHQILPEYFSVLGIPLLSGAMPDGWESTVEISILVNEELARNIWPDQDPVGAALFLGGSDTIPMRVSGVVGNILDNGYDADPDPVFYIPFGSMPNRTMAYVVRVSGDPGDVMTRLRQTVTRLDPDIPTADLRMLDGLLAESVARPKAASLISVTFALVALLVAAAGVYGVLSYAVQARTRELGIRAALGASGGQLLSMVMGHSTRLIAVGLPAGLVGALALRSTLSGLLFGVRSWDPVSLALAVLILGSVGSLAAWIPARRAVRIDPQEALRRE